MNMFQKLSQNYPLNVPATPADAAQPTPDPGYLEQLQGLYQPAGYGALGGAGAGALLSYLLRSRDEDELGAALKGGLLGAGLGGLGGAGYGMYNPAEAPVAPADETANASPTAGALDVGNTGR